MIERNNRLPNWHCGGTVKNKVSFLLRQAGFAFVFKDLVVSNITMIKMKPAVFVSVPMNSNE